jgi:hypothetical protein
LKDKNISKLFNVLDMNRKSKEEEMGSTAAMEEILEVDDSELWMKFSLVLDRIGLFAFILSFVIGCLLIFVGIQT